MKSDILRRAGPADKPLLMQLIEAFYEIDRHEFERARLDAALAPLLNDRDLEL
jgi:hypothetical protein